MLTPRQEEELINALNKEVGEYDNFPEEYFWKVTEELEYLKNDEFKHVYREEQERHRWSVIVIEIYKIDDYYIACQYTAPTSETQEGQPTNMKFYYVEPYKIEVIKYKKAIKGVI